MNATACLISNALWACVCVGLVLALPMVRVQTSDGQTRGPWRTWGTVAGCVGFVLAVVGGGYAWLGSPTGVPRVAEAPLATAATAATSDDAAAPQTNSHTMSFEQIGTLTQGLAERLARQPDDAQGWAMLARSYNVLGRYDDAVQAYRRATALIKDDPQLWADFADALAMTRGRSLAGEPLTLVKRALALDARNLKALYLAGSAAFERKAYREALTHWELLQRAGPPDSEFVMQVGGAIEEARSLLGEASPVATPAPNPIAAVIRGRVSLRPDLAAQANPDDTVFVFARPTQGGRMPVAIVRKTVRDLPFEFVLDDSTAMSAQHRLSAQARVSVGARLSASGQATPQAGDIEAEPVDVAPGGLAVRLELTRRRQ